MSRDYVESARPQPAKLEFSVYSTRNASSVALLCLFDVHPVGSVIDCHDLGVRHQRFGLLRVAVRKAG